MNDNYEDHFFLRKYKLSQTLAENKTHQLKEQSKFILALFILLQRIVYCAKYYTSFSRSYGTKIAKTVQE